MACLQQDSFPSILTLMRDGPAALPEPIPPIECNQYSTSLHMCFIARPFGAHYNHYASPFVRGQLAKILITLEPHGIHSLATGMRDHIFDGRGFAEHQSRI